MKQDRGIHIHGAVKTAVFALAAAACVALAPQAEAQVNGKWITVLLPAEPPNIDSCNSSRSYAGRVIKYTINETLVQKNAADGALMPRLATSWEQIDPLTWRFKLREGVTFHDGTPFTAEAAKRSLDREAGKAISTDCGDMRKFFAGLPFEAKAIDSHTLEIKTARPESIVPMRLTGLVIAGPNTADKLVPAGSGPVGTGPFVFDSWQGGQQILFKRNDKYWGPKPQAEGVRYIWRAESAVRAAMVKLGEADISHSIGQEDATDPKMDFSYLNSETTYLRLDTEKAPLNDRRVRMALRAALDLGSLVGTIMPKTATRATQVVFPSIPGHNREIDKINSYDPARAKQLLAEARAAGVPVDTPMDFVASISEYPNAQEAAEAFHGMWKAAGFNIKLMVLESGEYAQFEEKPYKEDRQPMILLSSHDNNFGDPVFTVIYKYGCAAATSAYCNPDFDREVTRVSGLGGQERVAAWQELFRALYQDHVVDIPLYHMVGFTRVNPRINFVPDVSTTNEIRIGEITFK